MAAPSTAKHPRVLIIAIAGMIVAMSVAMTFVMIAGQDNATLVVRCPGGEVDLEGVTLKDGTEISVPARTTSVELRPAGKPPQRIQLNLQPNQRVVLDCAVE